MLNAVAGARGATSVRKVFIYVYDFLVWYEHDEGAYTRVNVMAVLENCRGGSALRLKKLMMELSSFFVCSSPLKKKKNVCWAFRPHFKQAIIDCRSAHSKIVKRGIAL